MTLHRDPVRLNCPVSLSTLTSPRVARNILQATKTREGGIDGNGGMETANTS